MEPGTSDDPAGLHQAIQDLLAEWQSGYVYFYFLRNAVDCLPRKAHDGLFDGAAVDLQPGNLGKARPAMAAWLARWRPQCAKLPTWAEEDTEETLIHNT